MEEASQRMLIQYPPPPAPIGESHHDFAQSTAVAALQSGQPPNNALPQHSMGMMSTPPANPRKRKPAVPGSRGVANLTPEQLTKKRANDREAQRAIRERTKATIGGLEARIRELESQQPYLEMQRAIAERDRALNECEELRRRLEAVAGIVGNQNLGQMGLNQLAALTAQQAPLPPLSEHAELQQLNDAPDVAREAVDGISEQPNLHPDLRAQHDTDVGVAATADE